MLAVSLPSSPTDTRQRVPYVNGSSVPYIVTAWIDVIGVNIIHNGARCDVVALTGVMTSYVPSVGQCLEVTLARRQSGP